MQPPGGRGGQVAAQACKPGDRMPAFLLPSAEGRLVESGELLAQGPLVVTFFRGGWCPCCSATLEAVLPELSRAGGTLVAMTPETGGRALAMKRDRGVRYEVLVDVDLAVAVTFASCSWRRRGVDLAERSGNPVWLLPVPAAFLVGRDGIVRRSRVNADLT